MEYKELTIEFNSSAGTSEQVANELNDLKNILLSVAFKLDEDARKQIIKELSAIESPGLQEWLGNLKMGEQN
ncbi:hypothetical protein [Citrobacter portucalensis]|uniref:Uncharacterized protein n=2 Tax=Enterobacteriaceae TaxID=543 RepID=A0A8I0G3T9_CITBR|nr:hypothetical protein [Citrobacter portucalensis]ATX92796.1 hypothetical protein AM348_14790 [Citrobacter freundii]AVD79177.1 hypothetical protein AM350_16635 [Citrobacter freundii]MBD3124873.1 hypothetical protein [Citrobacter braakii]